MDSNNNDGNNDLIVSLVISIVGMFLSVLCIEVIYNTIIVDMFNLSVMQYRTAIAIVVLYVLLKSDGE